MVLSLQPVAPEIAHNNQRFKIAFYTLGTLTISSAFETEG